MSSPAGMIGSPATPSVGASMVSSELALSLPDNYGRDAVYAFHMLAGWQSDVSGGAVLVRQVGQPVAQGV